MVRIGLKLWNTNENYLYIANDLYKDRVFDYIELYIVPQNKETLAMWQKLGIPFHVHAPHSAHSMNLSDSNKKDFNYNLYSETKYFADGLDAEYIVFHGGTNGNYREVANQIKSFNDKRSLIENKPYKVLKFVKANEYTGTTPEEIKYIKDYAGCGFCLDIGHAICSANSHKKDPYVYINEFARLNPKKIHLSDIDTSTELDEHLNFGYGKLDFSKLKTLLNNVGDVTIETNKKSKDNLEDFIEDVKFIRRVLSE